MSKKEEILRAAAYLFATKGFKEASMAEVAAMTATAGSNIFYHFKTKEDIFLAVLKTIRDDMLTQMEHLLSGQQFTGGMSMIEHLVASYLSMAKSNPHWFMLLHRSYPHELAAVNPSCRESLAAIYEGFIDLFERAIRAGQEDGSVTKGSARKKAMVVFAMVDGVVRFDTHHLYEAGALYDELMTSCRRMLKPGA